MLNLSSETAAHVSSCGWLHGCPPDDLVSVQFLVEWLAFSGFLRFRSLGFDFSRTHSNPQSFAEPSILQLYGRNSLLNPQIPKPQTLHPSHWGGISKAWNLNPKPSILHPWYSLNLDSLPQGIEALNPTPYSRTQKVGTRL